METFNFLGSLCSILCFAWEIGKCISVYIKTRKKESEPSAGTDDSRAEDNTSAK